MLDQVAQIFVVAGSIAVIFTLIAVFIQLRRNNQISTSSAYQSLTSTFNQFIMSITQDDRLLELYTRGRHHPEKLTQDEKERFFFLCAQMYGFHENLYILRQTKSLPKEFYEGWRMDLMKNLQQAGFLLYWQEQGDEYATGFRKYVNELLEPKTEKKKVTKPDNNTPSKSTQKHSAKRK